MEKIISCCGLDCAECEKMETCELLGQIHQFAPAAKENLRLLN